MELKYTYDKDVEEAQESSNRTFMELKFISVIDKNIRSKVLIAPLWN